MTGVGTGSLANKRGAREQGNEMIAVYAGSFRLRLTRKLGWVGGELLECIMHAKWRGFLQITGAAPLPDEGVLR